jgi:glycosidase
LVNSQVGIFPSLIFKKIKVKTNYIMKKILMFISMMIFANLLISLSSCSNSNQEQTVEQGDSLQVLVKHPDWAKSANIYEVNLRQYTPGGTIKEFEAHLPRLKEMGVDILWFMPIFEIGKVNRKATQTKLIEEIDPKEQEKYLGSYYGIKDYLKVNPEFGTMDEFKALVKKIHEMGMYVILDIAVNHTAWDHAWVKTNPDFYTRVKEDETPWKKEWMEEHPEYYKQLRERGMTYPVGTDWWDTADLNFDNEDLREEMKKIFKFWVEEANVDGYRCDVAGMVPTDFWEEVRPALDSIKPVFMLAEAEQADHHNKSFDASYAWEFHHIMNKIAKGEEKPVAIDHYFAKQDTIFPESAIRMQFITNHDENSWNGTIEERLGDASKAMAVLTYTVPGMPLIYSGQEAGLNKRLLFFEKDEIDWDTNKELGDFYKSLSSLKKNNSALWNGEFGAKLNKINTTNDSVAYAFVREDANSKVLVVMNLSKDPAAFSLSTDVDFAGMNEYFGKR